ncbi:MAG: redoxin domain-containing protein [Dehalococcoidia bacterium]|nr:redoxin domain-containing protein [Dehalococcoidia bacterium]
MTMRLQMWPGVLLSALLVAALMMLAVACGSGTQTDEQTTTSSTTETTTDAAPEVGNRVGNLAPDFSVTTTDGVTRSLTDFKQANQPVVVYFFASW